jgi:GH43 family beta-xylosidase
LSQFVRAPFMRQANPVYAADFADPFCFEHEGVYYAISTGHGSTDTCRVTGRVIKMIKSLDLRTWTFVGHILEQPWEESGYCYWAPEIACEDGRFYLYYHTNGSGVASHGTENYFRIRCGVSNFPEGPYVDAGEPLTRYETTNGFAIDSSPFRDDDGQWYLYYSRDFYDFDASNFRGTALVVDKLIDMTRLADQPVVVMRAHWPWQMFMKNRLWAGVERDWYTLEGPSVVKRNGTYYLFYSGGCWENESYGVDFLTASHPLGPWTEHGKDRGPQVTRTIPGKVRGPGHNSIVRAPDGTDMIVYHAWNAATTAREMWIDPIEFTPTGPKVVRFAAPIAGAELSLPT